MKRKYQWLILALIIFSAGCVNSYSAIDEIRTNRSIQKVFDYYKYDIYEIYSYHLKKNKNLSGGVIFAITINFDGKVIKSEVNETTTDIRNIAKEVNDFIYTMNFGKVIDYKSVSIEYPIEFEK